MNAYTDTLETGASVNPNAVASPSPDLAPHLLRIIRRAMRHGDATPLNRAIQLAVATTDPADYHEAEADTDLRARTLAGGLSAVIAPRITRGAVGAERHRATVRN